jgi:hypothetical protein
MDGAGESGEVEDRKDRKDRKQEEAPADMAMRRSRRTDSRPPRGHGLKFVFGWPLAMIEAKGWSFVSR